MTRSYQPQPQSCQPHPQSCQPAHQEQPCEPHQSNNCPPPDHNPSPSPPPNQTPCGDAQHAALVSAHANVDHVASADVSLLNGHDLADVHVGLDIGHDFLHI